MSSSHEKEPHERSLKASLLIFYGDNMANRDKSRHLMYEKHPADKFPSAEEQNLDQSASNAYSELFRAKIYQHYLLLEASGTGGLEAGLVENPKCNPTDFEDKIKLKSVMREKPFAIVVSDPFPDEKQELLFQTYGDLRVRSRRRFRARISRVPAVDVFSRWLVENPSFQTFILLVIAFNCITLGIQAEYQDYEGAPAARTRAILDCLDILFLTVYMFEILLKWLVNFRDFWDNPWNVFDFLVTLFTFITTIIGITGNVSTNNPQLKTVAKNMRAFQVLRIMKILTRSQGIKVIVFTVTRSLADMGSILILFVLFLYIFLVTGVIFMGDLDAGNATDTTDVEMLRYRNRFQDLYWGFLTLYQIFTIDHWYAMLHNSWCKLIDGVFPTFYMLLWLLIGSLIFRNIFAGVVVNTFQALRQTVNDNDDDDEEKELSDTNFSELKQFVDREILKQNQKMTSNENLLLEALDSETDLKQGVNASIDPAVKLNQEGAAWLCNSLKSLHLLNKLIDLKPTKWTKELLFQYFEVMEKLQESLHERQEIIKLMDEWIMNVINGDDPQKQPNTADRAKQLKQFIRTQNG